MRRVTSTEELKQEIAELREKVEQQEKELQRLKQGRVQESVGEKAGSNSFHQLQADTVDRRQFLTKVGAMGVVGLGATIPAKNTSGDRIQNENLSISPNQTDEPLDLQGNDITNIESTEAAAIHTRDNTGEVFAREFDGTGLATKVENALAYLSDTFDGRGRIRITPRKDGDSWVWESEMAIATNDRPPFHLDVDDAVEIEYPGDGWFFTFDQAGERHHSIRPVTIRGGQWILSDDSTADGWLRMKDVGCAVIDPAYVNVKTGDESVGVSLENHGRWSEMNHIAGTNITADICIDTVPSSITGGGGSNSFDGTRITTTRFAVGENGIGVRCRGGWTYSKIDNTQIFLHGNNSVAIDLHGSFQGCTFDTIKTEGHAETTTAVQFSDNYDRRNGPLFINCYMEGTTNYSVDNTDNSAGATNIMHDDNGLRVFDVANFDSSNPNPGTTQIYPEGGHGSLLHSPGYRFRGGHNLSAFTPEQSSTGVIMYHDGSGENNPEGPAFYNGDVWVSLVDGETIHRDTDMK